MMEKLVRSDARMAHAREATDGFIARLWLAWLEQERKNTPEERRRLELTGVLKVLRRPSNQRELYDALNRERARFTDQPETVASPADGMNQEPGFGVQGSGSETPPENPGVTDQPRTDAMESPPPVVLELLEDDPF